MKAKKIEFVSYDGGYPNLCSGTLVLKVDGTEKTFGYDGCDYPMFWSSGGSVTFDSDWSEDVRSGEWRFSPWEKNEFLEDNKDALMEIFNKNVPQGCCGGCV